MDRAFTSPAVSTTPSKGFLSLPRELRDMIYQELLSDVAAPPPDPKNVGPRLSVRTGREEIFTQCVLHPAHLHPKAACEGLYFSNRQIQAEIQESGLALDYHLDIMVECFSVPTGGTVQDRRNLWLWPTWTVYPQPVSKIRELCVDVRVFGPFPSDIGFPFACTPLLLLVNRLIHYGPQFIYKGSFQSRVQIETLTVKLFHDKYTAGDLSSLSTKLFRGVSLFAHTGAFTGIISRIRVRCGESVQEVKSEYLQTERLDIALRICRHGLSSIIDRMKHDGDHSSIVWGIEMSKLAAQENKD